MPGHLGRVISEFMIPKVTDTPLDSKKKVTGFFKIPEKKTCRDFIKSTRKVIEYNFSCTSQSRG